MGDRNRFRVASRKNVALVLFTVIFATASFAQRITSSQKQDASALPQFEVATIKPTHMSPTGVAMGLYVYPGGRIHAGACTVEMLLHYAFNVWPYQIKGGPQWAYSNSERYDIDAIPSETSPSRKMWSASPNSSPTDEQRQMLQSLLIDRFQLRFHWDEGTGPVYFLEKGKNHLRLNPTSDPTAGMRLSIGGVVSTGKDVTMSDLASYLGRFLQRPVIDRTGLTGAFDFEYDSSGDEASSNEEYADSIIASINGIGLRLKNGHGSIRILVIDSVAKPSPN